MTTFSEQFPIVFQALNVGFLQTLKLFFITLIGAIPLGLIISFGSMSAWRPFRVFRSVKWLSEFKPVRAITRLVIWVVRGTPLMLQLLVVYFGPFYLFGMKIGGSYRFLAIIVGFALNYAAYFAEIYRSGIESMPQGQYEAARVLGYSKAQCFCHIIFPQVVKRILPSITNEVITLVKDTSLSFSLAYAMFTIAKQIAASQTTFIPFVVAAIFYYVFNLVVAVAMETIEKKMSYYQ